MAVKRWWLLPTVAVALLTAGLGAWQLDRAAQKEQLQQSLDARAALPPLAGADLPRTTAQVPGQLHRRAQLQGHWLNQESVYLDNRTMAGRAGFYLVTPLLLDDGTAVLVQRGWMARDLQDRTRVAPPPAAPDTAQVIGRIAPALARLYEFDDAVAGPIRQNLDIDAYARETKRTLRPWVLVQLDSPAEPSDGLLRQWPAPNAGVHKNYGYAFQWFSLSVLTIVLYVWFQFIRPHRRRAA